MFVSTLFIIANTFRQLIFHEKKENKCIFIENNEINKIADANVGEPWKQCKINKSSSMLPFYKVHK